MKKLLLVLAISATFTASAEEPAFFVNVTNLWYQGYKSNVLAIAEERLASNSNDIAGLVLKMEYGLEFEFEDLQSLSNSIQKVIDSAKDITTPRCASNYPDFKLLLEDIKDLSFDSSMYNDVEADKAKANLPGKPFLFEDQLLVICLDGLVTNYPPITP